MPAEVDSGQKVHGAAPCPSLAYTIFWTGMPAGKAQLQCHQSDQEVVVQLKAETHAVLNAVYPLRIDAKSRLLADGTVPLEYQEYTREGRKNTKTATFVFAPEQNMVNVFKNGRLRRALQVPAGTMDPLGGAYRFLYDFRENGKPNVLRVTDGRRIFEISLTFTGYEAVKTPWGNHDAEVWRASVRVLTGKPHPLEASSIRLWTLTGSPSIVIKMTVGLPYGEFSTQLDEMVRTAYPPCQEKTLDHPRRGGPMCPPLGHPGTTIRWGGHVGPPLQIANRRKPASLADNEKNHGFPKSPSLKPVHDAGGMPALSGKKFLVKLHGVWPAWAKGQGPHTQENHSAS